MILRRYAVTVMDNWTSMRMFWTFKGAEKFRAKHPRSAYLYKWDGERWRIIRWPDKGA